MVLVECDYCKKVHYKQPHIFRRNKYNFCSGECHLKWMKEHPKKTGLWKGRQITINCKYCGEEFKTYPSLNRKFCSRECYGKWLKETGARKDEKHPNYGKVTKVCESCGKEFKVIQARKETARFCSRECLYKWESENLVRDKRYNWKGWRPSYFGSNWNKQRKKVLKRDNNHCKLCGNSKNLNIHHIIPREKFEKEEHEKYNRTANLITLCASCHMKVHWSLNPPSLLPYYL